MRAEQVLDYQRTLRDSLRTSYYREYLEGFLKSTVTKSGYLHGMVEGSGDVFADNEIRVLESAYAFHVDSEMAPLIRHAAAGLDEKFVWEKEVFPTDRGFIMFDEPLRLRELRGRQMRSAAVTWYWGQGKGGQPGVWLALYSLWDDPQDEVSVELRKTQGDARMRGLGPLHINHMQFMAWGHSVGPAGHIITAEEAARYATAEDPVDIGTASDNPLRELYATLALMGQTVTDVTDEPVSPALARHLGKKRIPPRVVIITLRRTAGSRQPGESMVDWAYRWVVRGHWRRQPYGPGRGEIRVIYIAPFVKGPDDKPLHISDKVYTLRR